ncbi:MAG: MlaE family ABC transporter permease [Sulfurihydrogenibium sp.]|uniref:MlaE family ABC transporter permease n=1 Tax=Sulfurihydrogenibium sp. TaxID=2053621 RepID=UPI003C7A1AFD
MFLYIENNVLYLKGYWTVENFKDIKKQLTDLKNNSFDYIDASQLEKLDFYGGYLINQYLKDFDIKNIQDKNIEILKLSKDIPNLPPKKSNIFLELIEGFYQKLTDYVAFVSFTGEVLINSLRRVKDLEARNLFKELEETALKSLGIITVLSFLIGVVIAYQSSAMLATFGANIFIVDLVSISLARELSPLIVGIIVAGRSASSFTAEIGLMKVSEEIDFLKTLGISPYSTIVLPKLLTLIVWLPILITYSTILGILGAMIVSDITLGIPPNQFFQRLAETLSFDHYLAGVVKGPVFGITIGLIGVYEGFKVQQKAESIGFSVTKSVVRGIFAIILIDAIFSVIYRWLDI